MKVESSAEKEILGKFEKESDTSDVAIEEEDSVGDRSDFIGEQGL